MINWLVSRDYATALFADAVSTYAAEDSVPESLRNFLARLRLLYGVPFNYLVPDSRLLPVEAIRFFYIDRNFTDRLVDGALSVGKATTREFVHAQSTNTEMKRSVDAEEGVLRKQLRGGSAHGSPKSKVADLTGLLLRSRAVSGWPGLEVKAYQNTVKATETEKGDRLTLLRMDRLAPDVMLCIFDGVPKRVDVEEPREGIQFGVDLHNPKIDGNPTPDADVPSGYTLNLRWIRGAKAGQQMGTDPNHPISIPVPVRKTNRHVVHVEALRDALAVALKKTGDADANPGSALSSGELALELFQFPFRQRFEDNGDPKTEGGPTWTAGSQYINAALRVSVMATPLSEPEIALLFPTPHVR
jgi:hypothetical protein